MPRARATAGLASLIESDSEPDLDFFDNSSSQLLPANKSGVVMSTMKKPRGRPAAANRVTKPESRTTRRTSGRIAAAATTEVPTREILADKSNANTARGQRKTVKQTKQNAEPPAVIAETPVAGPARGKAARGRPKTTGRPAAASANTSIVKSAAKPRGRPAKKEIAIPEEIPETQAQDAFMTGVTDEDHLSMDEPSIMVQPVADFDICDVSARRRLGELTRKYESLQMRYQDLQEVGLKEADRNFERLRKESDERILTSRTLIADLKAELKAQTAQTKQGEGYRKQLEESEARAEDLQATINRLNKTLDESKSDIKALSTKLAASRSVEANVRLPGSALKGGSNGNRPSLVQVKEDLYGDLTGLIMRDVRREKDDDIFDCIQTGRNGSLHFNLTVESTTKPSDYDGAEFTYRPRLDNSRDAELMDMLPDFLTEEITFERSQAAKFYARVMKSMTERVE